jgi:hypothetical protein
MTPSSPLEHPLSANSYPSAMDNDCVSTLEETVAKLQARDIETQNKLDQLLAIMAQLTQTKQNLPETPPPVLSLPTDLPRTRTARLAAPPDFDGERMKGMEFLNSCQTYMRLCPKEFPDEQMKIVWEMSSKKIIIWSCPKVDCAHLPLGAAVRVPRLGRLSR